MLGAIEAGGTKFVVAVGDENGKIIKKDSFPTTTPNETMQKVFAFFDKEDISALGIGCFGPVDLDKESSSYGYITTTPKEGWKNFDIRGSLQARYPHIHVGIDTDVNASAYGEAKYGQGKNISDFIYLTIGTGIGGGAFINGQIVHGMLHPEMGHMRLTKRADDSYIGKCEFHHTCFEGLAAGPAIEARWSQKGQELDVNHPAWDLEAWYIAQALANYVCVLSPKKIILGGGVMHQTQLFPMIRKYLQESLNGYIDRKEIISDDYIVAPQLGDNAGIIGAFVIAQNS